MDQFQDIRPYNDEEVRPVIEGLLANPDFIRSIAGFSFPRLFRLFPALVCWLAHRRLTAQLKDVHTVKSMQGIIALYMDKMIEKTTSKLTHSGLEALNRDKAYLFISNHRDIAMDPAFVNYMQAKGIAVRRYYTANHGLKFYQGRYREQDLSYTNAIKDNLVSLPLHTVMSEEELEYLFRTTAAYFA